MKKKFVFFVLVVSLLFNAVEVYGQLFTDPEKAYYAGLKGFKEEWYDVAIYCLDQAIKLKPNYHEAYFARGRTNMELEEYAEAIADFTKAIQLKSNDANYYYWRGVAYYGCFDYDSALADANAALKIDPNHKGAKELIDHRKKVTTPAPASQPATPPRPAQPAPVYVSQTCSTCKGNKKVNCFLCGGKGVITSEGFTVSGYGMIPDVYVPGVSIPCTYALCVNGKVDCNTCGGKGTVQVLQTAAAPAQPAPAPTPTPTPTPAPQPAPTPSNSEFEMNGTTLVKYNGSATNVTIPNSVTVIGKEAFQKKNLARVTIPNSVTSIGDGAFSNNNLTSVTIPNGVTTIGTSAFSSNKLVSVIIPNSVTSIGGSAFSLNKLTSVTIPNSVTSIGSHAFSFNELTSVNIPKSVTSIGNYAFYCKSLTTIVVAADNAVFSSDGGILFNKDKTKLIMYPQGKSSGGTYNIPNNVTSIESFAFDDCKLTAINIPNSVTFIDSYAFGGNNLTSVTIPVSVTSIGNTAFQYNDQLNSVTIGANVKIGSNVFRRHNDKGDIVNSGFEEFYEKNGKKAGTYTYDGKNWTAKTAPAAVQPTPTPVQPAPAAPSVNASASPNVIPLSAWSPSDGESPGVTKKGSVSREVIDGQQREVLTMEVTFPRETQAGGTSKWGALRIGDNEPVLSKIRTATGVRFKALGDGKRWIIQFHTKETMVDWCSYEAEIKTVPNRVVEINIPYSSLKQPNWGKQVPFVKNNVMSVNLQRMTDVASEIGPSTLKVFDFEVYSDTATAAAPPSTANANPNFIPPSVWNAGDGDAPGVTKKIFKTREVIAGQEKDVLTLEVTFPRQNGGKWGTYSINGDNETVMSQLRTANGIRFKALGDGKRWIIQVQTKDTSTDWCGFEAEIKTTNNRVVDITIPYSSLKQATWGKKASWNKSNIIGINIQRNSSDSGASTLKVFDFEVY